MVTASVQNSADGVQGALGNRDIQGIAALAVLGAGGVFLGQEFADQVLPMLDFPQNPSSTTDLAVSAGAKLVAAVVLGIVASRFGGTGQAAAGVLSFGVLVSMGMDVFDLVQRGMDQNAITGGGSSTSAPAPKRVSAPSSGGVQRAAPAGIDNGSFR